MALVIGSATPQTDLEIRINEHCKALERRGSERRCYRLCCAGCNAAGPFAPHDVRKRRLRVIVASQVLVFWILIGRWRCQKCRHVFTDYPDFRTPL